MGALQFTRCDLAVVRAVVNTLARWGQLMFKIVLIFKLKIFFFTVSRLIVV